MVVIKRMQKEEIQKVADFLANKNKNPISHIGYCGEDAHEIRQYLEKELTDIPYWDSFICGYKEEKLCAVLGFDADFSRNHAEIWGPFLEKVEAKSVDLLWGNLLSILPPAIQEISMFPSMQNKICVELAERLGLFLQSKEVILQINKGSVDFSNPVQLYELTNPFFSAFIELHTTSFPSTYYSGEEILERLDNHKKVFISKEYEKLTGYIYVEVEPAFQEASIEYFAVNKNHQGVGMGTQLLRIALNWIFSFPTIPLVTLCVNASNQKALHLYNKVGFKQKHELYYLKGKI